eukprot:s2533_g8.t1
MNWIELYFSGCLELIFQYCPSRLIELSHCNGIPAPKGAKQGSKTPTRVYVQLLIVRKMHRSTPQHPQHHQGNQN